MTTDKATTPPLTGAELDKLEALARAATPQNLDSAEDASRPTGYVECPECGGEGTVELTADYCNYDGKAMGVQFYGVGPEHRAAEAFFRAANPATVLALIAQARAAQPESATGTTGASQSIDTPEFSDLLALYLDAAERAQVVSNPLKLLPARDALIAHIDAIIGDLRAQLAAKGQSEPVRWEYRVKPSEGSATSWRETSKERAEWYRANPLVEYEGDGSIYEVRELYLAAPASAQPAELERLREIARLIGSIFVHGDFKAETHNERELEKLLRAQGTFYESLADYDAKVSAQPAVKLTRDGSGMCEVSLEIDGVWVPVIRDNGDFISHIVEPLGVRIAQQRARMKERFDNRPRTAATADFDLPAPNDPIGAQPDRGAAQALLLEAAQFLDDSMFQSVGQADRANRLAAKLRAASPASQLVAPETNAQQDAAPSDIALELLHYPSEDGHILVRLDDVKEILARRAAAVAPSDAKGKATDVCKVCNGTRCVHSGPFGDPPEECEACFDQSPADAKGKADDANAGGCKLVETEMADRLRRMVLNHGEGPITVQSKMLLQAADECDRFYNGMMNWKANAQAKDRTIIEQRDIATSAADAKDAARFRWLNEDHVGADVREKARDLAGRLGTSSYYAITRDIDAAMAAAPSSAAGKEGGAS